MSTSAGIMLPIREGNAALGRYHHWDGYPGALGKALLDANKAHKGYDDLVSNLIFKHAGWSSIVDADWSREPGFGKAPAPQCYCHPLERAEIDPPILCVVEGHNACQGIDCDPVFIEWTYWLYPSGFKVYHSRNFGGTRRHVHVGRIKWDTHIAEAVSELRRIQDIEEGRAA